MQRQGLPSWISTCVILTAATAGCAGDTSRRSSRSVPVDPQHQAAPAKSTSGFDSSTPPASARLRRTVTLGSSYGGETPRGEALPASDSADVDPSRAAETVYVVQPPFGGWGYPGWVTYPGWGYGGYGPFCDGCARQAPPRLPASPRPSPERPPALGEDWSPPPSYGPRFPFKTTPADPWR